MANASTIDFQSAGKAIKLPVGKSTYALNLDGSIIDLTEHTMVEAGNSELRTKIAKQLEKAYLENPKATPEQLTRFTQVMETFGQHHNFADFGKFAEASIEANLLLAKGATKGSLAKADAQALGALLAEHPKLETALSADAAGMLKEFGADAKKFATSITGATKEIEDLVKGNKLTAEAAQKTLEKHGHEVVDHLPNKAQLPEVTAAKGTILKKIDELHGSLAGHYDDIVKHHGIITDKASDAKAIADAEAALKKSAEAVAKIEKDNPAYVRHFDEAIEKHASKDLLRSGDIKGFEKHAEKMSTAAKSATAAVGDKAKLLGGGKWYSFVHSAESAGSQLERIGKVRWGKAAIVGIPAAGIVAYATGAIGRNREVPGKYESQVLNQQQNVAEQGLGVA